MDFVEASLDIAFDQNQRFFHCGLGRKGTPCLRAEVIAAEGHAGAINSEPVRHFPQGAGEVGGGHAGISTVLVGLIAGRFDHDGDVAPFGPVEAGAEGVRVGGADRDDGTGGAGAVVCDDLAEVLSHPAPPEQRQELRLGRRWRHRLRQGRCGAHQSLRSGWRKVRRRDLR